MFILALSFLSAVIRGFISSEGFNSILEVSNAFTISGQVFRTTYFRYWLLLELEDESIFLSVTAELFFFKSGFKTSFCLCVGLCFLSGYVLMLAKIVPNSPNFYYKSFIEVF